MFGLKRVVLDISALLYSWTNFIDLPYRCSDQKKEKQPAP